MTNPVPETQAVQSQSLSSAGAFVAVTPSNTVPISYNGEAWLTRGILVGVAGNITVNNSLGAEVTIAVLAGIIYPIITNQIYASGTSATGIVAFF